MNHKLVYEVVVCGQLVIDQDKLKALCSDGYMTCWPTGEMIDAGIVSMDCTLIAAPREWFRPGNAAGDWVDVMPLFQAVLAQVARTA